MDCRWGIWIMCTVILRKGYWASIASPLFVMLLILKGSGVPLQEKQVCSAIERLGDHVAVTADRRLAM